jgi:hypothetical protein
MKLFMQLFRLLLKTHVEVFSKNIGKNSFRFCEEQVETFPKWKKKFPLFLVWDGCDGGENMHAADMTLSKLTHP